MTRYEQIKQLLDEAAQGTAGKIARDVRGERPTAEEMIDTLIAVADAHSRAVLSIARWLDALAPDAP